MDTSYTHDTEIDRLLVAAAQAVEAVRRAAQSEMDSGLQEPSFRRDALALIVREMNRATDSLGLARTAAYQTNRQP